MTGKNSVSNDVRWDLSVMYLGIDDSQIDKDIETLIGMYKKFSEFHKGKLTTTLPQAIKDLIKIDMLENKIKEYLFLLESMDVRDDVVKAKVASADKILGQAGGEHMAFFSIELAALDNCALSRLYAESSVVANHQSWIEKIRENKPYMLSEEVESALIKRMPFGPNSWSRFHSEVVADLEFDYKGQKKSLEEMLDVMTNSKDCPVRYYAMVNINHTLKRIAKYSVQTLYMTVGASEVEDKERGYKHPMSSRNLSNRVRDDTVNALHEAVINAGGPLARRFYRLKAAHLKLKTPLKWSDRNAPMPFADMTLIPFDEAMETILAAYESFSPALAGLVRFIADNEWVDVPPAKGKRGIQYNSSFMLPGWRPVSYIFLQYFGSGRDVMTLAHELGHGVHGLLALWEQGPLMAHAPIVYNETASIFGEMVTFNFLKRRLQEKGDRESLLALLMDKTNEMINTVVRQIGFSNFERRIYGMNETYIRWDSVKKLSVEEVNQIWLDTLEELYGKDGEVFLYENAEYFWSCIPHFHMHFYVYGYAFGELLAQSLYAQQLRMGNSFEPLYLDLLKAGSTKDVAELLEPFGLDPTDQKFWINGISNSIGKMLLEAEDLSCKMGIYCEDA